jgi:hypothetical protein
MDMNRTIPVRKAFDKDREVGYLQKIPELKIEYNQLFKNILQDMARGLEHLHS